MMIPNDIRFRLQKKKSLGCPDPDITVCTVLDRAAQNIGGKFTQQPEVEASIRNTIGAAYQDLGVYPQARAQFERALDIDRRVQNLSGMGKAGWWGLMASERLRQMRRSLE